MPSLRAHRNITMIALNRLTHNLPKDMINGILKGVIDPDIVRDKVIKYVECKRRRSRRRKRSRSKQSKRKRTCVVSAFVSHHNPVEGVIDYYVILSFYYFRRNDRYNAGFMLGRALHYVQDSSLSKFNLANDVDKKEKIINNMFATPKIIEKLCYGNIEDNEKISLLAEKTVCVVLEESIKLLNYFVEEIRKPIDIAKIKKEVMKIRLIKMFSIITILALLFLSVVQITELTYLILFTILLYTALFALPMIILYQPTIYYEAMKAGLMIVKPDSFQPAY